MRKLATFRDITDIIPIPNADSIECAIVDGGWQVVVQKGNYQKGDHVIFIEIDSWVPTEIAPFLSKGKEPKEYNGVKGERLRTVKLRKQISQGLILSCHEYPQVNSCGKDDDLSEVLGIIKWEPEIPANLRGKIIGNFPSFIPKTDQERIQNLSFEIDQWNNNKETWEVTEKLDGSSMTVYFHNNVFGVCSRNFDLAMEEGNSFWRVAINKNLETNLKEMCAYYGKSLALQGELVGPGIQKNLYALSDLDFFVFDIYDINSGSYIPSNMRLNLIKMFNLNSVPVFAPITFDGNMDITSLLRLAEDKSLLNNKSEREGLVFKNTNHPNISFKAISNKFLLKNGG